MADRMECRRLRVICGVALVCAVLAGCGSDITALDELKDNAKAGDFAASAEVELTCTEGEACAQARLLKADTCYQQAKEAAGLHTAAALDETKRLYDCAITNFGVALALNPPESGPAGALCQYRLKRLDSLNMRSRLTLADANDFASRCPDDKAGGAYYSATAIIIDLQTHGQQSEFCKKWKEAAAFVSQGQRLQQSTYNFNVVQASIDDLKKEGICA